MNTPNGHEHRTSTPAFLVSQLLVGDPQMQEIIKNTPPTEIILALIHLIRPSMELFALHWHLCHGHLILIAWHKQGLQIAHRFLWGTDSLKVTSSFLLM